MKIQRYETENTMVQEKVNRINELARKSKTPEGLTEEEKKAIEEAGAKVELK